MWERKGVGEWAVDGVASPGVVELEFEMGAGGESGTGLPKADAGVYLPLSLGVTFPFNIIVGIPLYLWVSQQIA